MSKTTTKTATLARARAPTTSALLRTVRDASRWLTGGILVQVEIGSDRNFSLRRHVILMRMLKRSLVVGLAAIALSACGGQLAGTPSTGTVTGHVQLRVCGGAAIADQPPCRVSPAQGTTLTFDAGQPGVNKHNAVTNAAGAYSIALAPGTYTISIGAAVVPGPPETQGASSAAAPQSLAGPRQVTVVAGKTVTADFAFVVKLL